MWMYVSETDIIIRNVVGIGMLIAFIILVFDVWWRR